MIIKSIWHTFFTQVFWNYHTMASVGACYLLDKLLRDEEIPRAIRLRLIIFFNGNPYVIPYAISAVAKEVHDKTDEKRILKFIDSVVGILGAVGDQYYWNSVKPFFIMIPILAIGLQLDNYLITTVTIFSFIGFNFFQLRERLIGLTRGYSHGFYVVADIKEIKNRWGNLHFSKISFLLILSFLLISLSQVYSDSNLLTVSIVGLMWGTISGKRGNSQKYLIFALVSYILMEMYL
ncbi:MAG: PTS system mannose/fructose/sorbose family transporter subunit IID [Calditrichaeota bacterium]|nr:PTS system mannose/fructose/sorbose family transporter subunit IID [Calditrichota bacterium]